jgi:hypothetical protein
MKELHLYDWDGTLFRSPEPTADWAADKEMWWRDLGSLSPPCVPKAPGAAWFNGPVLGAAKKSIARSDVLAVMSTGRRTHFTKRLKELMAAGGLRFNVVAPKTDGRTEAFKTALLHKLLDKYPTIEKVVIYDDRAPHLAGFKRALEARGLTVETNHIRIEAKEALCELPSPSRVASRYLAA